MLEGKGPWVEKVMSDLKNGLDRHRSHEPPFDVIQMLKSDGPWVEKIVSDCKDGIKTHLSQDPPLSFIPVNQDFMIVIELLIFYMKALSGYRKGPMNGTTEKKWKRFFNSAYFAIFQSAHKMIMEETAPYDEVSRPYRKMRFIQDNIHSSFGDSPAPVPLSSETLLELADPYRSRSTFVLPTDVDPEKQTQEVDNGAELHRYAGILGRTGSLARFSLYGQMIPHQQRILNGESKDEVESEDEEDGDTA